jgi:hypothetical protein
MSKFYVGQKVVALKTHPDGWFKKGEIFEIFNIIPKVCFCKNCVDLDFGMKTNEKTIFCDVCRSIHNNSYKGMAIQDSRDFAPIQEQPAKIEYSVKKVEVQIDEAIEILNPMEVN